MTYNNKILCKGLKGREVHRYDGEKETMKKCVKTWAVAGMAALFVLGSVTAAYAKENIEDYRAVFDAQYYYDQNPDLQESIGMNPEALFEHFATSGAREGRSGNAEFNLKAYIYNNPDLFLAYKKDLSEYCKHYAAIGKNEGRIALRQEEQGNIIGSWTTYYDESIPRATNVRLAAQRIHGKVLQPGEVMSFSNSIMSRTKENGYVVAPLIKGYGIGGGICQVSSTLYAAMCQALMPVIERHPHSKPISYLPVGLDATISEGYMDLRFANTFDKPIQLLTSTVNGALTVTIQFYDGSSSTALFETQGTWREENGRWWYDKGNGVYLQNGWYWIDGNRDGRAECYYFDAEGWMAADCRTPDGYRVDANGAWIENGQVQIK